jgi:predicted porin
MDTPSKKLGRSVDLFHSTQLGENRSVTALHGGDARRDNVIQWNSNDMGGLKISAQYSADAQTGNLDSINALDADIEIAKEIIELGLELAFPDEIIAGAEALLALPAALIKGKGSLSDNNDADAFSLSGVYTTGDIMVGVSYDDTNDAISILRLAGSYKMGDIKLVGFYETADLGEIYSHYEVPSEFYTDATTWGLGASMKSGKSTFKVAYYDMSNYLGIDIDGVDADGRIISVGVDHALSSSTMIYATAADATNFVSPAGAGHDDKADADSKGISFGIRTKF